MPTWPPNPSIYEINAWTWLSGLSAKHGTPINLGNVPAKEWDALGEFGFDSVWLMGVWERSPAGIAIANQNDGLVADFRRALPDYRPSDNVGSPYCVRSYTVDPHLGGRNGLAVARKELSKRGMRLLLDLVANHVSPDNDRANKHPEYFIQGTVEDLQRDPASFMRVGNSVIARGRDPYFPAWPDVLQLNPYNPSLREASRETVADIASQCDGIRCDMAMLLLNAIVERTWGSRAGPAPATEFWADLISATKAAYPDFLFIAEAYWDLEWELQQKGFDFCYDKKLYDRLEQGAAENVRLHLCADMGYQRRLLRFIENHDEPRAAATFSPEKQKAAAVIIASQPGARLFHDGQFDGRKVRLPVFLGRMPVEPVDDSLQAFYKKLLRAIRNPVFQSGQWSLCERTGWPDNASFLNLVAWCWTNDASRYLIVVNLSETHVQARVCVPWSDAGQSNWRMTDAFVGTSFDRNGNELRESGLYVELGPWNLHFLECHRIPANT